MANTNINYSEPNTITKAIRDYLKANFPACKFSVTKRNFNVITVALMSAPFEAFTDEAKQNAADNACLIGCGSYREKDLTSEASEVMRAVAAFVRSINYDDSDPYTDYFDRGFYDHLHIGAWNKPFTVVTISKPAPTQKEAAEEATSAPSDKIKVTTYVINEGTSSRYYGLKTVEDNQVLLYAPNNWKTQRGAIMWARRNGFAVELPTCKTSFEPTSRKKLTEKEWKKQLEAKRAFEAAEKEAERAEIERRFNALQVGDKLANGETVTKISVEEDYDGTLYTEIWTESTDIESAWCYYLENFLDGDVAFAEIPEPEEIDENQITFDEIAAYSANDTADVLTVPASPIDETAAKRGHEAYSFSDYTIGSATAAYNAAVADARAAADKVRERIPEEYHRELDRLVNRYAAKLADWTNRKNRVDASCPSWFIIGAANYPHKKHERQMQQLDKLFGEYDTITALEKRIRNFAYEIKHRPIKAGDASAVEKLRAKVEELTTLQNQMKQSNAEARKRGETAPYAAWALSNNRQNLKRYAGRLASLEKAKAAPPEQHEKIGGEGFRIVRNTDIMRLQFLFDGKPDERIRTLLKSNGFKWAPSQMAWQRQLTANAERAARTVANAI